LAAVRLTAVQVTKLQLYYEIGNAYVIYLATPGPREDLHRANKEVLSAICYKRDVYI
jgi:hypothetical protein